MLAELKSRPIDAEELALLHNIHSVNISGHLGRGFAILDTDAEQKTVSLVEKCEHFDAAKKPLWFVYSGMGSQWAGMGAQLMRIPVFAAAIQRCHRALRPKGIDIIHIITTPDKTIFDNVLHSFIGIAAIQIGLTDVLREIGLVPDNIIGHSLGELGCAYADGCFTAEEMILAASSRGQVSVETEFIRGSMAAVGLGYQQIVHMLPPEIEVACHNSSESSTISGPAEVMKEFVQKLTARGIFAREVPCSNIAYHSRYIAKAGPGLLKNLSEIIKDPKPRSSKWLSTSIPQNRWNEPIAKYSSAEYHTNNLLSSVLLEETLQLIPANAVLIEIAPHGLMQAILKRALPSCTHVPLTRRGHPDSALYLLEAVGKLYMEGYTPKVSALYPKVEFPVSIETPILSHMVGWTHTEKWSLPLYSAVRRKIAASCKFAISIHDEENSYLRGNVIKGKTTYPLAASLVAVWDTIAMSVGLEKKSVSVVFRDVHLFSQPTLHDQRLLRLTVALHRGTGRFEVLNERSKVACGLVIVTSDPLNQINHAIGDDRIVLNSEDIYKMFSEREYFYSGAFQSINCANISLTEAYLTWNGNWVTLIDGMLQMNALKHKHNGVSEPVYIRNLSVDIEEHFGTEVFDVDGKPVIKANHLENFDHTRCGGVLIEDVKFKDLPISSAVNKISLKTLQFVPRFQSNIRDISTALQIHLQIVAENASKNVIEIVEVINNRGQTLDRKALLDIPGLNMVLKQVVVEKDNPKDQHNLLSNADLVIVQNLSTDDCVFQLLYSALKSDTFVASLERNSQYTPRNRPSTILRIVSSLSASTYSLHLARWRPSPVPSFTTSFTVRSVKDLPILSSTRDSLPSDHKLLVLTSYPPIDEVKELVSMWRKDANCKHVYLLMINHKTAEDNNVEELSDLDLAFNILEKGSWGGEYYVPLKEEPLPVTNMTLQSEVIGDINSLRWVEVPKPSAPGIPVTVHYAGLNNLDVKRATGVYPIQRDSDSENNSYGMDFSGVTQNGARVMGIIQSGAASKEVRALPQLIWPVPKHWTLEEAATVPLPYAHAFYCLAIKSQLSANRSILVHGGAGALGQAAISIALAHGLRVFTTVSDMRKKHFLRKLFPELKEDHIGNSRDNSFGDMVLTLTKGVGVDYVINCVKGELKNTSLNACAAFAIVLETQTNENFYFRMNYLSNERNYVNIDFSSIFTECKFADMKKLQWLVSEGIARGYVRPLSRVSYAPEHAARALRLLEASRHRGRVLLRLADATTPAHPRIISSAIKCSVIVTDNEDLGMQLAEMLITRGAKKLHLHLPRASPYVLIKKQSWEKQDIEVKISSDDLTGTKNLHTLLNESVRIGPIEGIFFIHTTASNSETHQATLTTLDIIARKLCPVLKHFAVLSNKKDFGNQIIILRAADQIPATKLYVPLIKVDQKPTEDAMQWPNVLEALERALRSNSPICCALEQREAKQTLLQKISNLSDMTLPEHIEVTSTLEELGVKQEKIDSIEVMLRNEYHTALSEDDILSLSVQQIQEIEQNTYATERNKIKGLDVFFSHVDTDELMATTEMVFLPTMANSSTTNDDEFDISDTYLCIVPGLEGHHERFRELCERVKVPALVLQPGLDYPDESIQQTARRYAEILLKRASLQNHFYLLGYETGLMVALEMAAILEKQGLTGTVYCIGAAPDQFKSILQEELRDFSSVDALQEAVIHHMYGLMGGKCEVEYNESASWHEKVESCVRALKGRVPLSTQYVRAQFEVTLARLLQSMQYIPHLKPLRSQLVLLCPDDPKITPQLLQKYSQQRIVVHQLGSPLAHALKDLRCATVVNQHLHPDILHAFNKKNLCDTYLLNTETLMTAGANQEREKDENNAE
ncbi:hypothetical protein ABMA28_008651 [Loxostege sticticalis]|uniref:Uncharacterized protein n=1 Tax=Loxostege sticticalis TaxID=481309 RepID=A0ABD0SE53_LOXSC